MSRQRVYVSRDLCPVDDHIRLRRRKTYVRLGCLPGSSDTAQCQAHAAQGSGSSIGVPLLRTVLDFAQAASLFESSPETSVVISGDVSSAPSLGAPPGYG